MHHNYGKRYPLHPNAAIFVVFSMKMSRACSGKLSSENDDLKFFKTAKNINAHHSSRAHGTVLSLQTSLSLTRNMKVTSSQRAVLYIFQNISKF